MAAKGYLTESLLDDLINITQSDTTYIQKKCLHLREHQLLWRPSKESWNIKEILAHLNSYSEYYNDLLIKKLNKHKTKVSKEYFVSSPLGRSAWKSMKLGRANNVKRKFRATKPYNPTLSPELITEDVMERFLNHQEEMVSILETAKVANLKKIKIPMSISKLIRLRMGDALMFITYHTERHVQQIKNTINHPKFPKK
ncbi:MAG TPA: DinB family protein [Brumimicrobium sp.]|nr:DinB family protein [Brumimicrobium sp.]